MMTPRKQSTPAFRHSWIFILVIGLSFSGTLSTFAAEPVSPALSTTGSSSDDKVQVYILAGQSNMVGFGYLQGAQPVYPSIYLSADPNIKVGRMPVGNSALL
ncbi:MAG: sialate O-acetylesterase, partial [Planctomycetaceae bacterium]|nr:sialate O-acetylesterase [Planctomycetaceae bacterium]